jgi:hypothetical protein
LRKGINNLFIRSFIQSKTTQHNTTATMTKKLFLIVVLCVVGIALASGDDDDDDDESWYELPEGVIYDGPIFSSGYRRRAQRSIFRFAESYTTCNRDKMIQVFDEDVLFSYLFVRYNGLTAALTDIDSFCVPSARPNNVSVFFEADGFAIDTVTMLPSRFSSDKLLKLASSLSSTTFGSPRLTTEATKFTEFTEWLSDSVRFLQQQGVLNYDEGADPLLPWPTYVAGREGCARRVTHTCADAPCQPSQCVRP